MLINNAQVCAFVDVCSMYTYVFGMYEYIIRIDDTLTVCNLKMVIRSA